VVGVVHRASLAAAGQRGERRDSTQRLALAPELDIVVWAPREARASATSKRTQAIFRDAAAAGLHLAVARLPRALLAERWSGFTWDEDEVACLRSCLIKPEHADWVDRIFETLESVA
jgi:hypothetical protein